MKKNSLKGILYCLLTSILWGTGFPVQYIGGLSVGSFYFNAFRTLIAVILLFLIIVLNNLFFYKKIIFFNQTEDKKNIIIKSLLSGFVLATAILIQQIGVEKTISAKSGLISSLTCIVVPIILMIFENKNIKIKTWFLILILIIGMIFLNNININYINFGDIICFISTIFFSIDIVLINKFIKNIDTLKFSMFRFLVVFVISIIFATFFDKKIDINNFKNSILVILYSGIFVTSIAYTMQILGEKYTEPLIATILMGLEGLFATIFGFLILNQKLTFIQILGCIIIVLSTISIQISESKYD